METKTCGCECTCGEKTDPYTYVIKEAGLREENEPRTFKIDIRRITNITPRGYCTFVPYARPGYGYILLEVHTIDGTYNIAYGTRELAHEAFALLLNYHKWGKGNQL